MKRLTVTVRGRVQGVSFRYYAREAARRLDLSGWVKNEGDGSVMTVAEGQGTNLEAYLGFLRRGSPAAIVNEVAHEWSAVTGEFRGFEIRW